MSATVGARATSVHREPSASTHEATTNVCVITVTTAELVRDITVILLLGLVYIAGHRLSFQTRWLHCSIQNIHVCTTSDSDPYLDSDPQSLLFPSLRWISIPGLEYEWVSGNVIEPLGLIYTDKHRDRKRFLIPMNRHRIAISMVWMVVTLMISALSI